MLLEKNLTLNIVCHTNKGVYLSKFLGQAFSLTQSEASAAPQREKRNAVTVKGVENGEGVSPSQATKGLGRRCKLTEPWQKRIWY